jgi:hypothetical protein
MNTSPRKVWFDSGSLWVELHDDRVIGAPLSWFPRLLTADKEDLMRFELSLRGIHWDALDEDISSQGLLEGHGDMTKQPVPGQVA